MSTRWRLCVSCLTAWAMSVAVTRKTLDENVHGPQVLSRVDALRAVMQRQAWLSFEEGQLETLDIGKLADVVMLYRDYLTCSVSDIAKLSVERTIVGGRTVFRK